MNTSITIIKRLLQQLPTPTSTVVSLRDFMLRPPSQRFQAPGNNYVTPPQLSISLHASRHIFVSGNSRNHFGITCRQTEIEPLLLLKTCNVEESNSQSSIAVRGAFGARSDPLSFFWTFSSEVGAPTSNSEPSTSVRGNRGSLERTTSSPDWSNTTASRSHLHISARAAQPA